MKTKEELIKAVDAFHGDTERSKSETLEALEEIQEHISDLCLALEEEIDAEDDEGMSDDDMYSDED